MVPRKCNLIVDGGWGSCGKGLITSYLAWKYRPDILSTTNMANAGHTVVDTDGESWVAKALPSAAILHEWYPDYSPHVVIGATAAFYISRMLLELRDCGLEASEYIHIHPRAGVITDAHAELERDPTAGTKHLASTMQGCGAFLADKIMRRQNIRLAADYAELDRYTTSTDVQPIWLRDRLSSGATMLHEGSQGFSMDISHGNQYPQCTSRQTTAMQAVADLGLSHRAVGDIYLVIRPYPIRVGNVIEDGHEVGNSGGCYPDQKEITWEEVGHAAGYPEAEIGMLRARELTTVTRRVRRVYTFSKTQLQHAATINGATCIALNFANYIDYNVHGSNSFKSITPKVREFVDMVEDVAQLPVTLIGTGPRIDNVIDLESPEL